MKKCPEKQELVKFLDFESGEVLQPAIKEHVEKCQLCQNELAKIKTTEENLKRHAQAAFSGNSIKQNAMEQIRSLKPVNQLTSRKSKWFWILAPGLAVILVASLVNSVVNHGKQKTLVSMRASGINSLIDAMSADPGREIDLATIVAPMRIKGDFVFKIKAAAFSEISHSGESTIFPAINGVLKLETTSATLKLLSGNPVKIFVNGVLELIDKTPVEFAIKSGDKALPSGKTPAVQLDKTDIDFDNIAEMAASKTCKIADKKTEVESMVASDTEIKENIEEVPTSVSDQNSDYRQNLNPFLDNPVNLNEN
ncbi:MAG: hypothetical protein Kow0029_27560 [Candidatus Rifleibacteriota bacterium]